MTILVDLDGVIGTEERTFERALSQPLPGAREGLQSLCDAGHTVVLYSARSWSELKMTQKWLADNQIPYHGIHFGKPVADRIIDDRAIPFRDWSETLAQLQMDNLPYAGGPTDEGLLRLIRTETRNFLISIAARQDLMEPILEVGPMVEEGATSGVFQRMGDTFIDSSKFFGRTGKKYITLDIDPTVKADKHGDFNDAEKIFEPESIGTAVILNSLEHMPRVWRVPQILHKILKPRGRAFLLTPWNLRFHGPRPDCWRISDDGYHALFDEHFEFEMLEKIACPGRPLSPVGMKAIIRRKGQR